MLAIKITSLIILLISLTRNVTYSEYGRDSIISDDDSRMLREILQRLNKMQNHMDNIQTHIDRIERNVDQMKKNNTLEQNLSVAMEAMKNNFCCCQYQNTTTPRPLKPLPTNCAEAMGESGRDGTYKINIANSNIGPLNVYCMTKVAKLIEEDIINGKWLIIQRRQDNTTDFYQNWNMYQRGFGNLKGNLWIGLDKIYALTKSTEQELWVQLEDRDSITAWAIYSHFAIGNEDELYELKTLGRYDGTAGDSLRNNTGCKWSTYDRDNDKDPNPAYNCAGGRKGAWWFSDCGHSSLNGVYGGTGWTQGILWDHFRGLSDSMKYAHMAIRPRILEK